MARDYDSQLLESVSVRRRRLRDALLFGAQRARRTADERLGKVFAGIAIAAVLCAGCVGWSFVQSMLEKQKDEQRKQEQKQEKLLGAEPLEQSWHSGQFGANGPASAPTSR
ncbi:hypothetical protein ACIBI4_25690 [Streptomyces sp. NPDC050418]|uniref:hypothetical protein n=1 Tax=Streptomyces sp. NPDC050418 TaxID=3365612 RepID=UPI0037A859B8